MWGVLLDLGARWLQNNEREELNYIIDRANSFGDMRGLA